MKLSELNQNSGSTISLVYGRTCPKEAMRIKLALYEIFQTIEIKQYIHSLRNFIMVSTAGKPHIYGTTEESLHDDTNIMRII